MKDLTIPSSLTMTSREIAEITGKRHDHVLRDIDNLLGTLPPDLGNGFKSSVYVSGNPPREYRQFELDRDSTFCLMSGYDAVARMKIIKRWQALESGETVPAFRLEPMDRQKPKAREVKDTFGCFMAIAKMCKFDGNMAILSANQATQAWTGVNPLALMGRTSLEAEGQEQLLIVSELAERLEWATRLVNPRLTQSELQTEYRDHKKRLCYELTEMGRAFGVYVDTGKKHGDGAPVRQIKWRASVVDFLNQRYPIGEDAA